MKVGVDLGGSHIGLGIVDDNGKIIEKFERRLLLKDKEEKNIKNTIENYITENFFNLSKKYFIEFVGIAVPGSIYNNIIEKCVNLGLKNYDLVKTLKENIKSPIKIANDCKCAAIAESKYGALKNYKRTLFLTLGTGIGGAVIINGSLLDCGKYSGTEFGHMIIQKNGLLCNCGKKGCFEKYGSIKALKDNLRKELNLDEKTSGKDIIKIIKENKSEKINKIIEEYVENLSIGISNLINIFEPEALGIGGSFVYYTDILLEKLKKEILKKNYLFNTRKDFLIIPALLGNDAGIIGSTIN